MAKCYDKENKDYLALSNLLKAKTTYSLLGKDEEVNDINFDIYQLLFSRADKDKTYKKYLDKYIDYVEEKHDSLKLTKGFLAKGIYKLVDEKNTVDGKKYLEKALKYNENNNDKNLKSTINRHLAFMYNEYLHNQDSALYYYKADVKYLKEIKDIENLCSNYVNQAACYYYLEDNKKAIQYLHQADSLPLEEHKLVTKQYIYEFLSINYEELEQYKEALYYLNLNQKYRDSVKSKEQDIALKDIQTKYQTREKELENQVLKSSVKSNQIMKYTFLGLLIATIALGWLIVKNARRREKISLQEKQIEQQKREKALKDFELSSIDLLIEGQEKERQRLANDLHDNLGSMLATLKINFENLKRNTTEGHIPDTKLYDKTDDLIDEAYQRVRRLAHAKNAGVFANQGLIPAVKKLADKVSVPGRLTVDVLDFGFDGRLDNTLEFTIFRAIQELTTNIIKHAKATEATIQLTQHDDDINIIIEDNGIGFDTKWSGKKDGMGLQAIIKKIKYLNGNLDIDSTPGKGTTIIINIPI
ncbi:sensor histidine kinase [Flavobacterium rhizosphaerae]|uniref:Oxygen sensor histidine kinase NreB n=1 Tax=Flavobacterium rhizosphaerae TaxID=3163298 RepID=A0ABW8YTX8_9FLAO